jgi:hypothetical protein
MVGAQHAQTFGRGEEGMMRECVVEVATGVLHPFLGSGRGGGVVRWGERLVAEVHYQGTGYSKGR